ncbi:MAG: YdeI/OmpD-associated family protein [Planctomycetota bacterium]
MSETNQGDSNLKRPIHPVPEFVREALERAALMNAYRERPAYQQNDYIGWINSAKREQTKRKRLDQMLVELEQGGVYMKMDHPPSKKANNG